ncbi:MAG: T9SS type A sorting domain-containing protein [Balneolaceae bacterium]|nr:T9SS type A sorting domain-containing protein [Balneolaceae bacterium]
MKILSTLISGIFLFVFSAQIHAQVDYSTEIQPIFNANCTGCHGGTSGLNLRSYSELMSSNGSQYGTNLVIAGNPDASGLVDKIEPNPQFGNRMPSGGQLAQSEINLIRTWIAEGANEVATSSEIDVQIPESFRLIGNYPNPFNPATNIKFEMPEAAQYTISVYSVHGNLLLEEVGQANTGVSNISVNMGQNPTGVYLYRVTAMVNGQSTLIGTGRMTLIK